MQASEILNIVGDHDPVEFRRALEQIGIILALELCISLNRGDIVSTLAKFMAMLESSIRPAGASLMPSGLLPLPLSSAPVVLGLVPTSTRQPHRGIPRSN